MSLCENLVFLRQQVKTTRILPRPSRALIGWSAQHCCNPASPTPWERPNPVGRKERRRESRRKKQLLTHAHEKIHTQGMQRTKENKVNTNRTQIHIQPLSLSHHSTPLATLLKHYHPTSTNTNANANANTAHPIPTTLLKMNCLRGDPLPQMLKSVPSRFAR